MSLKLKTPLYNNELKILNNHIAQSRRTVQRICSSYPSQFLQSMEKISEYSKFGINQLIS